MTSLGPAAARAAFVEACALDVAVRKPGNVSAASAGHRMQARQFIDSAQAAAGPLTMPGLRVGARIEAAVRASWAAAGCNTNLGIVLLCAPIAAACERPESLRPALERVLDELDLDDSRAAFRAIALANPGGLGDAPQEDVHAEPTARLREAMALAADRDSIARQYRDGYADLFDIGLPALAERSGETAAVQHLYLTLLARGPDSHIVRKHGEALAQNVMASAQAFLARETPDSTLDDDPAFIAWDEELKRLGINPGTTADLTVATLMLRRLSAQGDHAATDVGARWHGT